MLSAFTCALYSPEAFKRFIRSWSDQHVHDALKQHGPSLPREYRHALQAEATYRVNSWSRGNEGGG